MCIDERLSKLYFTIDKDWKKDDKMQYQPAQPMDKKNEQTAFSKGRC